MAGGEDTPQPGGEAAGFLESRPAQGFLLDALMVSGVKDPSPCAQKFPDLGDNSTDPLGSEESSLPTVAPIPT